MLDTTHIQTMPQLLEALEQHLDRRIILNYMEGRQVFALSADGFFAQTRQIAAALAACVLFSTAFCSVRRRA